MEVSNIKRNYNPSNGAELFNAGAIRYFSNGPEGYIFLVECIYVFRVILMIPNCYLTLGLTS
jgi:hypothetical protein